MSLSDRTLFNVRHPLVSATYRTDEEYVLQLIHRKAYEFAAEEFAGKSVLDWGCNDGYGLEMLRPYAKDLAGLDVCMEAVAAARCRLPEMAERIRRVGGVASAFPGESFDAVTCFQVIEHVADTDTFLKAIHAALKPGGCALFTTPNRLIRLDSDMVPWNDYHVNEYDASEFQKILERGFAAVTVMGMQGDAGIADIERGRCAAMRRSVRRRDSWHGRTVECVVWRLAKLGKYFRKDASNLERRWSTSLLYYSTDRLDDAIDLLAVCRGTTKTLKSSTGSIDAS